MGILQASIEPPKSIPHLKALQWMPDDEVLGVEMQRLAFISSLLLVVILSHGACSQDLSLPSPSRPLAFPGLDNASRLIIAVNSPVLITVYNTAACKDAQAFASTQVKRKSTSEDLQEAVKKMKEAS